MPRPRSVPGDEHQPPGAAAHPPLDLTGFSLARVPEGFVDDPYPWYAALQQQQPRLWWAEDSVLLSRHADVMAVYRAAQASSDKRAEFAPRLGAGTPLYEHHTTSLVFSDPPLHTRVRRILMGALNARAIARMEPGLVRLVGQLLDELPGQAQPDLIEHFAARIPLEVIGNLLDVPHADRGPLRAWSLAILSALEPAPTASMLATGHEAVSEFSTYLRGLIDHRRRHPGDPEVDVLTRLLHGDAEGALSEAELLHNCIFLLNAGHETTTNLIGNGADALLTHRGEFDRLRAEPALLAPGVEELLRFESPLQLNNRRLTAPLELDGATLPGGCFVTLAIGAANRDAAVFANPQRLDVSRTPNPHLAFGHGAHACSGMNLARLEGRIALGGLIERFPRLERAGAPQRDRRVRFRGLQRLPVTLS